MMIHLVIAFTIFLMTSACVGKDSETGRRVTPPPSSGRQKEIQPTCLPAGEEGSVAMGCATLSLSRRAIVLKTAR